MTASALYAGTIRHRRLAVRRDGFAYPLALTYLDLDELPRLLGGRLVKSRPGLTRFRRADYLGDPAVPLADAVRALVAQRTGRPAPGGPIRVLTQLRSLGMSFNPVSFYYLFDHDERVQAIVAEVTNTPWGERHAYVLPRAPADAQLGGEFAKELHVSPFMGMDQCYEWSATEPGPALRVRIASSQDGRRVFEADLAMRRKPLTRRTLAGAVARHPAATLRMLALIYAHALRLKLKGVPIHPHPRPEAP